MQFNIYFLLINMRFSAKQLYPCTFTIFHKAVNFKRCPSEALKHTNLFYFISGHLSAHVDHEGRHLGVGVTEAVLHAPLESVTAHVRLRARTQSSRHPLQTRTTLAARSTTIVCLLANRIYLFSQEKVVE